MSSSNEQISAQAAASIDAETGLPYRWRPSRTVVLVGLMGAGKTSVGRRLAQLLGVPFVDSDAEIEAAANATVAEIFEREGEAAFRDGERRVISRLLEGPVMVMATGGGAFMDPRTRVKIHEAAVSVWLRADLDVLVQRVSRRKTRPLLNHGDPREILERLIALRYPVYAEADLVVDSRPGPTETTVQNVLEQLYRFFEEEAAKAQEGETP
jgi:shikimate kinase